MQLAPTARLVPQVFPNANDDAFVPVSAMLVIVNVAVPVLVMVTNCELLELPTAVVGKESCVAERVTGPAAPVPLSVMVCGELDALSLIVIAAVNAPLAVGAKCP